MKKSISNILQRISLKKVIGSLDANIKHLSFDSRDIQEHTLFVAIKGEQVDGHSFINQVIEKRCHAVVCSKLPNDIKENITYIQIENTSKILGILASNFYDHPSEKLNVIGITGTNGKTTITSLLHQMFINMGYTCGLLSTIQIKINNNIYSTTHTTPDAISIQRTMFQMVKEGCKYCFMEVSSHGISQYRISGINFTGGVFTNITHDHLDYHKTFKEYLNVKKSFFDNLPKEAFALSNIDDKNGEVMLQNTKAKTYRYALKKNADFKTRIIENSLNGLTLDIAGSELYSRLIGKFNAYNLIAIYGTCKILNIDSLQILLQLSLLKSISGRFEHFESSTKITAIIDYAHTPDALENVLKTIDDIKSQNQQLITIVGCGGNRDKEKRPKMAQIACKYSNSVILTSDNPRFEKPENIIQDMENGLDKDDLMKTISITNRKEAIKLACKTAHVKDIIMVAGKGHETYQEIEGIRDDFDDVKVLRETLKYFNK